MNLNLPSAMYFYSMVNIFQVSNDEAILRFNELYEVRIPDRVISYYKLTLYYYGIRPQLFYIPYALLFYAKTFQTFAYQILENYTYILIKYL